MMTVNAWLQVIAYGVIVVLCALPRLRALRNRSRAFMGNNV